MTAISSLGDSLSSLRRARTSLKKALSTRGLPEHSTQALWLSWRRIDDEVKHLAARMRQAIEEQESQSHPQQPGARNGEGHEEAR